MINNGKTILYIATSLDGYVAGPNDEIEWLNRYSNVDFGLKEFLTGVGAIIMGRRSYDIGVEKKWFGQYDYGAPIFVVSHYKPISINKDAEFIFVTEGLEAAHKQAKSKARNKNVWIFGGANIVQQYLQMSLIDEISIGITPTLLGSGKRLFDNIGKYIELTLINTKQYDEDLVELNYKIDT
ncbi:MAG TPA: dihydrofolate reductase family protein [Nitrososphaeraceae archaeon]|nr:dihydrofolate reductase family protein [Nitrososphaeraceae archaeon]